MHITTEIRHAVREELKIQLDEIRKLIMGRGILTNWVKQEQACAMLDVGPRQLARIRIHLDKEKKTVGTIRWRKSKGKTIEYFKPDIEKFLSHITVGI